MQYKIPQNVQIEDKIVGPLTLKQLIICGLWGGLTYFVYVSLARVYYIETWIGPVGILGLFTLAFAFLKIHDIPFLQYILLVIEYSQKEEKRQWIKLGSNLKSIIAPLSSSEDRSKKEKLAEKTIVSLSDLSKMLDQNTFAHLKDQTDEKLDEMSDQYLLHGSFLGKDKAEITAHNERLKKLAAERRNQPAEEDDLEDSKVVKLHQLQKGNIEIKIPRR